jgi:regulator of replication initiation timing
MTEKFGTPTAVQGPAPHDSLRALCEQIKAKNEQWRSLFDADMAQLAAELLGRVDEIVELTRAPTLAAEVEELRAENDKLRAKLGNSPEPCAYCGIPADKLLDCQHGFPGCPRADDMVLCGHFGAAMETAKLREALAAERHKGKEQAADSERLRKSERDNEAQLVRIAACIGKDARQAPDHDRTIAGAAIAEVERLREENAELRTVMVAAAEEIHAHWGAHCDSEGYGPANLMRRLEEGIPAEYGYTAGRFAELQAESAAERRKVGALREALRPLWPVIEHAMAGLVFTAKRAGEVTAQMNAVRAALAASDPQRGSEPSTLQTPNPPDQGTFPKAP